MSSGSCPIRYRSQDRMIASFADRVHPQAALAEPGDAGVRVDPDVEIPVYSNSVDPLDAHRNPLAVPNPWVDNRVEQVDDEVDDEHHAGHQEHGALDDRVITAEGGIHDRPADAGNGENDLAD